MIVQIIGQAGAGKTTLALELMSRINAIHINADEVRSELNSDLSFSIEDRIEHARRLGALARLLSKQGHIVIVDFICPTLETRTAFGKPDFLIWVNRIEMGRYEDTNLLWQHPVDYDVEICENMTIQEEADLVIEKTNLFDWTKPTTLMLGRFQPWHEGHRALYFEGKKRTNQMLIGVRNTFKTSEKDPLHFQDVKNYIEQDENISESLILKLPNITNIVYGRDVGYKIEQIKLSDEIETISATQKRKEMGL